jgi:hypothetical protein
MAEQQNPLKPLFKDIADAIREKDGSAEPIPAEMFPERMRSIPSGGLPEGVHTITVTADTPEGGSVTGGGVVSIGMDATATVSANPTGEYEFSGWEEGGTLVSKEKRYSFPVTRDVSLVGKFFIPQFVAGKDWWEITLPSSVSWYSVTYGNGKFVAVAYDSDKAAYSTDGITWTLATLPPSVNWYSVTYGNGKFVAVAGGIRAAYSTDGINWAAATLPSSASWYSVTYGNGKFVAVASNSDKAAYSTDGITWTLATLPSSAYWRSVTYGDGKFVAVAGGINYDNRVAYSEDGITWTLATLPSSVGWYSVTYGNGKFVAVASNSDKAAYSSATGPTA